MYSWGDDTKTWKNPGAYDYGSARRGYLDSLAKSSASKGPRSYSPPPGPDMKLVNPKSKDITTDSASPLILGIDCTGSMAEWPAEIFDRLPLLYQTLSKYKPDFEVSFSVIGDAYSDQYPLQVADFGKGTSLDDKLKALFPEGNGGGQHFESYELWAYYMDKHAKTPKATAPFLILMGDEGFYKNVSPDMVKHYVGDTLESELDGKDIWKSLTQKYNVYLLHKPYDSGSLDKEIVAQWSEALGKQRVIPVTDPTRIVDVAMGIVARGWGNFDDYSKNLSARQDASGIKTVMSSLRHVPDPDPGTMNSKIPGGKGGPKSKPLS